MGGEGPLFPLDFDEEALVEDLARTSDGGVEALDRLRAEVQRMGGLPHSYLKACEAEGADGTNLEGCVKTYVPWPDGRFGCVMVAVSHPERPLGLRVIAFGVRHQPREANAFSVYEVAHRRLHC